MQESDRMWPASLSPVDLKPAFCQFYLPDGDVWRGLVGAAQLMDSTWVFWHDGNGLRLNAKDVISVTFTHKTTNG